jgi:endonuclease/exonuclease/phosphatase family metal-dependent hydrolase
MTTWRVLTWNVLGREQQHLERVVDHVRTQGPDIVALQEVRRAQARTIARQIGWHVCWRRKHFPYGPMWWRAEGLALLSPWPLSHARRRSLTPRESIFTYRHRIMLSATVTRHDDRLAVYNTHLSSDSATGRMEQAELLARLISDDAPRLMALCGDLNVHGDEPEVMRALRPLCLVDHGLDPTNPSNAPVLRLDVVLVPQTATDVRVDVPEPGDAWREISDHLPVTANFTLHSPSTPPSPVG